MLRFRIAKIAVLSAFLTPGVLHAGSSLALQNPATLTLQEAQGTAIRPLAVGGFNFGNWMPVVEVRREVASVAPTSLRFPAGNFGDDNDLTEDALRAFKAQLALFSPQPTVLLQTRVFSTREGARNRPEDAAAAARDARALGLKVAYWEIGNEPDLYATNRGDPSWTPERYCSVFRAQREAILKVDPNARFAGPGVSGAEARPGETPRREVFLKGFVKACGDVVDLLTWHEYPTDGSKSDQEALATASAVTNNAERFRALLKDSQANPLGHTREVKLGVTEYGLSWRSNNARHLADQVGALWAAEVTLRLAKAGVDVTSYFALLATGGHGLLDLAGFARPSLYAFRQLQHFKGEWLPIRASRDNLWTHAARDGKLLQVFVTNTDTAGQALAVELPGYQLIGAKTFTEQIVEDESDLIRHPLESTLSLPARSMTRLAYKRQSTP
ncbi:GH39 family glycosyl hydrolase [Deinococcus peraridilitoris]|uniref:Glycosyl hydrolases family 39 N-terminal catalytic domain-containing protein n=1 Tax=Deinococcus peraridilitoris (strain DSM 19664 / LMG 22246 / CIP 109416 / KR-200) TaxID=937777 RepID=K9ZYI9_DEIPD|nr:hypothetical protein [Deinococcus peraridilitoris]AFZ66636.1 hypothetical protein Deipe_1073 [Deinococcus peraridilitoris DSM 19664]